LLSGKTISFKENISVADLPMGLGTAELEGFRADFDATVVRRTLAAGGRVVGKNRMDGLGGGFGFGGGIGDFARPLNPHNVDHITGGSSSGCGVAVASSSVDIAFGGDQGGSVRIPAALCGVLGLKPTFGLVSHFGAVFLSDQSIDHLGPLARHAEDIAAALQATAGYDGYDPRQSREVPDSVDVLSALDRGVVGLRLGRLREGFADTEPEVVRLVDDAIDVLVSLGAEVVDVSVPEHDVARDAQLALSVEGQFSLFNTGICGAFARTYYPSSLISAVNNFWTNRIDRLTPRSVLRMIAAQAAREHFGGRLYAKAQNVRPTIIAALDRALSGVDLLVMPTCGQTAPIYREPGSFGDVLEENLMAPAQRKLTRNTMPYNYTGHPALALPVGKADGLPVSLQLVAPMFGDALLISTAYAYEHSVDWESTIAVD
jgi:amidase